MISRYAIAANPEDWGSVLQAILDTHAGLRGSMLKKGHTSMTLGVTLINDATTVDRHGKKFEYFKAVDTGRKKVLPTHGEMITFADAAGFQIFQESSKGFSGYQITAKALGKVLVDYPHQMSTLINRWYVKADLNALELEQLSTPGFTFSRAPKGESASPFKVKKAQARLRAVRPIGADDIRLSSDEEKEVSRTVRQETKRLKEKAAYEISTARTEYQKEKMRLKYAGANFREEALSSAKVLNQRNKFLVGRAIAASNASMDALVKRSDFLKRLASIPNKFIFCRMFLEANRAQVEHFKAVTPDRKELKHFKLVWGAGGYEVSQPSDGGDLKRGYKLVTDKELEALLVK